MPTVEDETEELNQQISVTTSPSGGYLTPDPRSMADIKTHLATIQQVMRDVMKRGVHYGTIPGCGPKPTLLKPGAEIIKTTFKLSDKLVVEKEMDCGTEINYRVTALITHAPTGIFVGSGIGECSTLETKYAWREAVSEEEFFDTPETHRRVRHFRGGGKKQQVRTVPADQANTILKMAKKRALVDAMLSCTACSDVFTQDIEDMDKSAFRAEKQRQAAPAPSPSNNAFVPNTPYTGPIVAYTPGSTEKRPHKLTILTEHGGDLEVSFFERPEALKALADPDDALHMVVTIQFTQAGKYRNLIASTFTVVPAKEVETVSA